MKSIFLSTPSARRATDFHESQIFVIEISIHALREEGDAAGRGVVEGPQPISIHALREEGDLRDRRQRERRPISIHALREEGDNCARRLYRRVRYFYPRPPRGGRRLLRGLCGLVFQISIHALREEGDVSARLYR